MKGGSEAGRRATRVPPPSTDFPALLTLFLVVQGVLLLSPEVGSIDPEEGMVPLAARLIDMTAPASWLGLVPQPYCGACHAGMFAANAAFFAFGDDVVVWKLLLLPFQVAWLVAFWHAGLTVAGRAGGWLLGLLATLSPTVVLFASWRGWLNHYESTAVALVGLALVARGPEGDARRALLAGLLLWGSLALSFTPVALVGVGMVAALSSDWRGRDRVALWAPAVAPMLLVVLRSVAGAPPWAVSSAPRGEWFDLTTLPTVLSADRWMALFDVDADGHRAAGAVASAMGLAIGALAGGLDRAGRVFLLGGVAGLLSLALGPFRLDEDAAFNLLHQRYLLPAILCLWTAAAVGVLALWQRGLRAAACVLLMALLAGGTQGRMVLIQRGLSTSHLLTTTSPSWDWQALNAVRPGFREAQWRCSPADEACVDVRAVATGPLGGPSDAQACEAWARPCEALATFSCGTEAERRRVSACGRRLPRSGMPRPNPAGLQPGCSAAWGEAAGEAFGRRLGTGLRPLGFEGWPGDVQTSFVAGMDAGAARPWGIASKLVQERAPSDCPTR